MATHPAPKSTIDTSKMSIEEMIALSQQLAEQAKVMSSKQFDETINFLAEKLDKMGKTKEEAMAALYELMNAEEKKSFTSRFNSAFGVPAGANIVQKPRQPRGTSAPKVTKDVDSTGARPELNSKYVDPDSKFEWQTKGQLGRTPQVMLDAVKKAGSWVALKAK